MNCLDFRRRVGADPQAADGELSEHGQSCAACTQFAERMRELDRQLLAAMQVTVPERNYDFSGLPAESEAEPPRRKFRQGRWMALAASLLAGVGIAIFMWASFPRGALAEDVVAHMAHEPYAWTIQTPVAADRVADVLEGEAAWRLAEVGPVTYVRSCWFRGRMVPHLVVLTSRGPVTLMVLEHENVERQLEFAQSGYAGIIAPVRQGGIAVLVRGDGLSPDAVEVLQALQ